MVGVLRATTEFRFTGPVERIWPLMVCVPLAKVRVPAPVIDEPVARV